MDAAIRFPGLANAWTMPIKTRIDMLSTGIKTPVWIKVSGPDLTVLQRLSEDIEQAMKALPETLSAFGDRTVGGYYLILPSIANGQLGTASPSGTCRTLFKVQLAA